MRRTETPEPIWIKFCMMVDVADVVTYTNFGDHRLRGFWVAWGQISPSPIDFHRRPYNTLALPCERVIKGIFIVGKSYEKVAKSLTSFFSLVNYFQKLVCNKKFNYLFLVKI